MSRKRARKVSELRPLTIKHKFTKSAPGSVLIKAGDTHVLCAASFEEGVPRWREKSGLGWLTAEYDMLPSSTSSRKPRNRGKVDGRTQEIQRLIGRSLRSVIDFEKLGENSILVDCDVLQADGGTRTASITGAFVAVCDSINWAIKRKILSSSCLIDQVAAVSVGVVDGKVMLDLDYDEDVRADVDLNLVMTGSGRIVEIQATGEHTTFSRKELDKMIDYGAKGIRKLLQSQRALQNS